MASGYLSKLEWLKDDKETVYDPECDDVLRVAFMHRCKRAKLADLVAMLSGRDFETREFKEEIVESTYQELEAGVNNVIKGYNFTQFMLAIRSAGFTLLFDYGDTVRRSIPSGMSGIRPGCGGFAGETA